MISEATAAGEKEPIVIVDHDTAWQHLFDVERDLIKAALESAAQDYEEVKIEHIGSTSVPELAAKPIIDILVGYPTLEDAERAIPELEKQGYEYVPDFEDELPNRRYLRKHTKGKRSHHLHMVETHSKFFHEHILFRDLLREDPQLREQYAAIKRELAAILGDNKGQQYTRAKSEFIRSAIAKARERQSAVSIRKAHAGDVRLIRRFIEELADYEQLRDTVRTTDELLTKALFSERPYAVCLLAYSGSEPAGFALYFYTFSTFEARPTLYLEDLFVHTHLRGRGIGKKLLGQLAAEAIDRDCRRFEWQVLDWNEPARKFYEKLGALPINGWILHRMELPAMERLADSEVRRLLP